jgi:CBS domain-containing protein
MVPLETDEGAVHGICPTIQIYCQLKGGVMTTARDIMTGGVECVGEKETLEAAARKMKELDVGSLPICGENNRL